MGGPHPDDDSRSCEWAVRFLPAPLHLDPVGGVYSRAALRNELLLDGRRWRRTWFFELLWRIDFTAVRRRMPMPSPHSEQAVSEHIASRRSWRNLLYRTFSFLHCQPHNFNKAV